MSKEKKRPAKRKSEWQKYLERKQEYDELWVDEYLLNQKQLRRR